MVRRKPLLIGCLLLTFIGGAVGVLPVTADPPPPPPMMTPMYIVPPVFCFRVTDILDHPSGDPGRFLVMFEVLNWTNTPAYGLYIAKTSIGGPFFGPDAGVKPDGRPIDAPGDYAQFAPVGGACAPPVGGTFGAAFNDWSVIPPYPTPTAVLWMAGTPLANRDLLMVTLPPPFGNDEMCAQVPGCHVEGGDHHPVICDPEAIDNGDPSVDGLPNNVLDGFALDVIFPPGPRFLSFNWFLLQADGSPIGMSGCIPPPPASSGCTMGFGTYNLRLGPGFPSVAWGRIPGTPEFFPPGVNNNTGVSNSLRDMFRDPSHGIDASRSRPSGQPFFVELGSALTAPFQNPEDNIFQASITARRITGN